jgi:beta-1,4-N-acetylglucosaminyltransferase
MPCKTCFVTVGATASFDTLIRAIYNPQFLHALAETGYTDLTIQCGKGGKHLCDSLLAEAREQGQYGISVAAFEFTQDMIQEMRVAKAEEGREEGIVLCHAGRIASIQLVLKAGADRHAGTGSVLDAIRIGVPVIVVPNPTLLDNHQVEFAEVMANMGYAVHGHLECVFLLFVTSSRFTDAL